MLLHLRDDDGDHALEVVRTADGWRVHLDGRALDLDAEPDGEGGWLIGLDGRRRRVRVAAAGDERLVFADGRAHRLKLVDPDQAGDDDAAAGGPGVRAHMPGKVVRVLVAEGATVAAGQPVVILESMKMETELTAGVAGTVARVHVAAGQVVGQGDALVDVAPAGDGA
ncbi:MAG TPA: acetyl-CoA carboxylase biotin carboxyl carrier protein subunit [Candidatus Krumholzibacteria bacterium]|nr:acetyl-CoA carboxylase biotin carboxyl carrier protein subunit [Candidatus Krumholzibacteria bacterium]